MRSLIRGLDALLRRAYGVFEFCDDPTCLFRIRVMRINHTLPLSDTVVRPGTEVLELHFWNEHIPPIPEDGPDLTWGVRIHRQLLASLRAVARQIHHDARLSGVRAVGGVTVLINPGRDSSSEKLFRRLGFAVLPYHSPLGRFGEFWENLYTWSIMWSFNAVSLRHRHLLRLQRSQVWMSVGEFLRRYG